MGSGLNFQLLSQMFKVGGGNISQEFERQMHILWSHPADERSWQGIPQGSGAWRQWHFGWWRESLQQ